MAEIIPFPLACRRDLIRRHASWYAEQTERAAEKNLDRQLQIQRQTLLRRGVDPVRVEKEVHALEGAIRATIWRLIMTPEGAA